MHARFLWEQKTGGEAIEDFGTDRQENYNEINLIPI